MPAILFYNLTCKCYKKAIAHVRSLNVWKCLCSKIIKKRKKENILKEKNLHTPQTKMCIKIVTIFTFDEVYWCVAKRLNMQINMQSKHCKNIKKQ